MIKILTIVAGTKEVKKVYKKMLKVVLKCGSCDKETLSSDLEGIFTLDFKKQTMEFQCPNCNNNNIFDWNKISNNRLLPKIKKGCF